jgi:hypothetical protein
MSLSLSLSQKYIFISQFVQPLLATLEHGTTLIQSYFAFLSLLEDHVCLHAEVLEN